MRVRFAALAACAGLLAFAAAAQAGLLVIVSGPSPYAACAQPLFPGETNYVNAEVEPWVAVNPASAGNVVGVWQQDRDSFGGAHGLVAGYSFDGGLTWGRRRFPSMPVPPAA